MAAHSGEIAAEPTRQQHAKHDCHEPVIEEPQDMDIELELKKLMAEREICTRLYRYQEAINRSDLKGLEDFFGDAQIATVGSANPDELHGVINGGKQFAEGFAHSVRYYDGSPLVQYCACNPIVQFNDAVDKATCHAQYFIFQGLGTHDYSGKTKPSASDFPLQVIGAGRYLDVYAHLDGGWKMIEREIYSDFSGDYSKHMRVSPAELAHDKGFTAQEEGATLKPQTRNVPRAALRAPDR
jgi:hypothetical protein